MVQALFEFNYGLFNKSENCRASASALMDSTLTCSFQLSSHEQPNIIHYVTDKDKSDLNMTSSPPPKAGWEAAACRVQRTSRQQVARAQETEQGDMAAAGLTRC